jgi:hypothetical protein
VDKGGVQDALDEGAATSGTIWGHLSQATTAADDLGVLDGDAQPFGTETNLTPTLVAGSLATTNGGTATITVSAASDFSVVYVGIAGLQGHYAIDLGGLTNDVELWLGVDQDYRQGSIDFAVSVGDGANIGPIASQSFIVVIVGSGDVQVSLTFSTSGAEQTWDDVDLWVMDPDDDLVRFDTPNNRTVASGGTLDLDANPICKTPHGSSENITWPRGEAPIGTYEVFVHLYDNCSGGPVNYTVTVTVVGSPPQIFSGTLVDNNIDDTPNTEVSITTFVVADPAP